MSFKQAKKLVGTLTALIGILSSFVFAQPSWAGTTRVDEGPFATMLRLPVYQWQDNQIAPKMAVLAIHGLTMHGTMFDACARKLAADGAIVFALDLRGYGAWYKGGKNAQINYAQSEKDIYALAAAVRQRYKGLPLFLTGESLGGSIAIRLAAEHPALIDGLILCAPAIKVFHSIPVRTLRDAALALAHSGHQLDVSDYIKKDFSEDSRITEEEMNDPLVRKQLRMDALLNSCQLIASTRHFISKIPATMPVLILQGERDLMVKPSSVTVLEAGLRTTDKTIQLFPKRGHILIETQHVRPETMQTILSWIDAQCTLYTLRRTTIAAGTGIFHQGG